MAEKEKMEFDIENPFNQEEDCSLAQEEQKEEQTQDFQELRAKFSLLKEELETQKNQYVRLAADFDNYRKRQAQERECLLKYGAEDTVKKLLSVLDTLERAHKAFQEMDDTKKMKESFDALQKQFQDTIEKIGVKKIETLGKEFDPNLHEAVIQTPTDEYPDHSIIAELQSGYKLYDRIVRPALVNVAVAE
jgi:molecular chaperone GrpE